MLYVFAALAGSSAGAAGMSSSSSGGMAWGSSGLPTLHVPTLALLFALLLTASAIRDLDRRAAADGYFHAVTRPFAPAGAALAATAAGPASGSGSVALAVGKGCQVATSVIIAVMLIMLL